MIDGYGGGLRLQRFRTHSVARKLVFIFAFVSVATENEMCLDSVVLLWKTGAPMLGMWWLITGLWC